MDRSGHRDGGAGREAGCVTRQKVSPPGDSRTTYPWSTTSVAPSDDRPVGLGTRVGDVHVEVDPGLPGRQPLHPQVVVGVARRLEGEELAVRATPRRTATTR